MIRVLHVLNNLGSGGVEALLMNVYRRINREKVQFDFLVRSSKNGPIVNDIKSMGGHVYRIADFPGHILKNYRELKAFLKKHSEYRILHVHANALIYVKPLKLARKFRIPVRIIHSHSTRAATVPFLKYIHKYNRLHIANYATHRFACSATAGDWMYLNNHYKIIYNGIDLEKFCMKEHVRTRIRNEYSLDNALVIGHVGRFNVEKNHVFILNVFAKLLRKKCNAVLMLVGDGKLFGEVRNDAEALGIADKVIFTSVVSNVQDYLSAMDVFVFPSLFEGFPLALIEAQAVGLPCIVSDRITDEAMINDNCEMLSIDDQNTDAWVDAILKARRCDVNKEKFKMVDIEKIARDIEAFYVENAED